MEGDVLSLTRPNAPGYFYPRPPGGGRHAQRQIPQGARLLFLSTPSGWRATREHSASDAYFAFLSTPSGWRATALFKQRKVLVLGFLSTPSGWRATRAQCHRQDDHRISIHALRVEGDPGAKVEISYNGKFLSTPSGWRATSDTSRAFLMRYHFYPRPPGGGRRLRCWC